MYKDPYKREAEGQKDVMMAAGSGVIQGQRQGARHPQKLEKAREQISPGSSRRNSLADTLTLAHGISPGGCFNKLPQTR